MAKLSDEELEEIISRDMPGRRMVKTSSSGAADEEHAEPDSASPDLDSWHKKFGARAKRSAGEDNMSNKKAELAALRREFFGTDSDDEVTPDSAEAMSLDAVDEEGSSFEDQIVLTETEGDAVDPGSTPSEPKAVVISGRRKKIIGAQG